MGKMHTFTPAPPAAVTRVLASFDRDQLAGFISVAIDLLDFADGDPDLEADDRAGESIAIVDDPEVPPEEDDQDPDLEETDIEDSFALSPLAQARGSRGAGCELSDAGEDDDQDTGVEDDPRGFDPEEDRCLAGDDGCGPVYVGGTLWWGAADDEPWGGGK